MCDLVKEKLRKYTQDSNLIDELTQLVLIKLLNYQNYNENQYKRLVGLICRSVYIDYYRSKKPEKIDLELTTGNIEDEIVKREFQEEIFKLIEKLPEAQRDVVILRYYFKLNYRKICEVMGVGKNTATSYLFKAKNNLKKFLNQNQIK